MAESKFGLRQAYLVDRAWSKADRLDRLAKEAAARAQRLEDEYYEAQEAHLNSLPPHHEIAVRMAVEKRQLDT